MPWLLWWAPLACVNAFESRMEQRVFEMRDHEIDAFDALVAFRDGELSAIRDAGARLARRDDVPALPAPAQPMLDAVRTEAGKLAHATDLSEAGASLGRLAARCGDCHRLLEVAPLGAQRTLPLEEAFFAVAFEEEARWQRIAEPLGSLGAKEATTWSDRRGVLERAMRERAGGTP